MNETTWKVFAKSGPWAVLAAILIGYFLYEVRPAVASIQAEHREMRAEDAAESARVQDVMGQVLMAIERSNYLERRNCINTARTPSDRDACARDR